jgi:hypothetical protein
MQRLSTPYVLELPLNCLLICPVDVVVTTLHLDVFLFIYTGHDEYKPDVWALHTYLLSNNSFSSPQTRRHFPTS